MNRRSAHLLLLTCLVLPLGACGAGTNKLLPGEWESTGAGKKCVIELTGDGKVHLSGNMAALKDFAFAKPLAVYADFGLQPGRNLDIKYRSLSDTELEIKANYTPLLEKLAGGNVPADKVAEYNPTEKLTYAVTAKQLTLTDAKGKSIQLRRAE